MAKKFSELPSASALTGTEIVAVVQDGVSKRTTSQDIADLTQTFFRGKYISLAALEAAIPTGEDGDYAIVDAGSGTDASQYIWDADEGWVQSSGVGTVVSVTGQSVNNTDPSNPVVNAWPLSGTEPTGFGGNVVIPGNGFNVALGQSGDRMGDYRVWASGTARIDGTGAAGIQSDGDVDMTSNAGILKLGASGHIITDNNAIKKGLQTAATGYVTDPRSYTDKEYVDASITSAVTSALEGLKWKEPVRAISTSNITLSGAQTIDGVSVVAGNRVLVAGQTTATDNGIYVAAAGSWSRSSDANSASELEGATVTVQEGTTNANTTWTQTTDGITLGSSNIVWSQFGSSVPNASQSVAGKVEIATTAEAKAGTTAGGTGADLVIRPDVLREKLRANRTVTGTDSIVQGDSEGLIYFNSASAFNFTIDQLVIDSYTSFINIGAGTVTFVNGTGVTISGATTLKQGQSGAIFYRSATAPLITVSAEVVGLQDLYVPASSMYPRTSNGCAAVAQSEIATSLVNLLTLDFDQTTQEFAQFTISLPRNWNNGTVTAKFYWTASAGTGGVVWAISGGAYSDDDALTASLGTAQTIADTLIATNDMHITSATSAVTLAGSPADADFLAFQISRNPADESDTLTADAKLIGIVLTLTTDSAVAG